MITSFLFGCTNMSVVCYVCIRVHIWVSKHTAGIAILIAVKEICAWLSWNEIFEPPLPSKEIRFQVNPMK